MLSMHADRRRAFALRLVLLATVSPRSQAGEPGPAASQIKFHSSPGTQAGRVPVASCLDHAPEAGVDRNPLLPSAQSRTAAADRNCLADGPLPAEADQIRAAGWHPFRLVDRPLPRAGIVVLGGLRDLTRDCAPASFQRRWRRWLRPRIS